MDFLFDLPAASAVIPVQHTVDDSTQAPTIMVGDVKDPPPK
jgi:hypothetical protein